MKKTLLAALSFVLLAACVTRPVDTIVPAEIPEFAVAAAGDSALVLKNLGAEPVYYAVLEEEFSTRARWAPCVAPAECPRVDPGQEARVAYPSITGYQGGAAKAKVFWYRLQADGQDGIRAGEVRSLSVRL